MASVIPKVKQFLFISFICLLINIAICLTAWASVTQDINEYMQYSNTGIDVVAPDNNTKNVTASNFAVATATSFLPFFDILNLALLPGLDPVFILLAGVILGVFGAIKLFLIITIVMNLLPFWNV